MAYITLDMLHQVAAEHKILLLGMSKYEDIKSAVMVNPERANAVWELANREWAAKQLEKLLVNGVLFLPRPTTHLKPFHEKVKALKYVIKAAQLKQFQWTMSPVGFTIGRWDK